MKLNLFRDSNSDLWNLFGNYVQCHTYSWYHIACTPYTCTHYHCTHIRRLKTLKKWRMIGTYLGFRPGELDNICGESLLHAPTDWLRDMLSQWLQWAPGDGRGSNNFATLEGLIAALNQAGLGATAHDLKVWFNLHIQQMNNCYVIFVNTSGYYPTMKFEGGV